jgi:hypothetical protein
MSRRHASREEETTLHPKEVDEAKVWVGEEFEEERWVEKA